MKKMMKRFLVAMLSVAIVANLVACGCGTTNNNDAVVENGTENVPAEMPEDAPAAAPEDTPAEMPTPEVGEDSTTEGAGSDISGETVGTLLAEEFHAIKAENAEITAQEMADKILAFENGTVNSYSMNYDDYVNKILSNVKEEEKAEKPKKEPNDYQKQKQLQSERRKLEGKIKRIEEAISLCEAEVERLNDEINSAGSDYEKITLLSDELSEKENEQMALMEQWEELSTELEEL